MMGATRRPPWWAWVMAAVAATVLGVGLPVALHRQSDMPNALTDDVYRVLIVGDSLTNGLYASRQELGYAQLTTARLEQSRRVQLVQPAINSAVAGQVASVTSVPEGLNLAVIELGTNDATRTSLDQFRETYTDLIAKIRATSPMAVLVCIGVWRGGESTAFDGVISDACLSNGGVFVPIADLYDDPSFRGPAGREVFGGTSDDFHPNDAGYAAIARRLQSAIPA